MSQILYNTHSVVSIIFNHVNKSMNMCPEMLAFGATDDAKIFRTKVGIFSITILTVLHEPKRETCKFFGEMIVIITSHVWFLALTQSQHCGFIN